jgi:hypothetical protein
MQNLIINRSNGNILKALDGQDHISGLLFLVPAKDDIPTAFADESYKACSSLTTAESLGLSSSSTGYAWIAYYHIKEALRVNPGMTLYVGFAVRETTFAAISELQQYADGNIRQMGVWDGDNAISATTVTAMQAQATALDAVGQPLSLVVTPKVASLTALPKDLAASAPNVSVMIGQDGELEDNDLTVGGLGVVIGLISKAAVNESIAWVQNSATGIGSAAFADGTLYRNVDKAVIESLDNARYLFFKTYAGLAGIYMNDSHNMDKATSDYCSIELERTMDKAVRGIRTYLLPELGRPIHFNTDGTLRADTLKHLKTVAGKAIEEMEAADEIDGYEVDIDETQDVQSTSKVEFVIKNIPVGVMRKAVVEIGFTSSI